MSQENRQLNWPNCYNVRDLGGLPTKDGATIQFGRIIRSDMPRRLSDKGRKMMWEYGVRTILDLRTPWQAVEEPSNTSLQSDAPRFPTYINISIETYKPEVSTEIGDAGSREAVYCIMLDSYPEQIKLIMEAIVVAREGGVLIHCHAGKDRTGTISALLLAVAGVSHEHICEDYALSQAALWPQWEKMVEESDEVDESHLFFRPDSPKESMQYVLDHLTQRYGGVVPYLQSTGLSEETLERLRQKLIRA